MTKMEIACNAVTWAATCINIWFYRRRTREKKQLRSQLLRFRDPEVRMLLARLEQIARGEP